MTSCVEGPPIIPSFLIQELDAIKAPNAMFYHLFLRFNVNSESTAWSPAAVAYGGPKNYTMA